MKKSSIICITTGIILVSIGLAFLLALPLLLLKIIDSKIVLNPDNPSYEIWRDMPLPITLSFFVYNVTNADEIKTSGAVPQLQQLGPFVFNLDIKKFGVNFTEDDAKVTFRENIGYFFDRQQSAHDLSLEVTTVNTPLALALGLATDLNPVMKTMTIILINYLKEEFFIERTVGQLLFDGYPDTLIKLAPLLNPKIPYQPSFGYMYNKNETNDGLFVVNSGKSDISLLNAIEELDGSPDLNFWSSNACNSLLGAKNGELYNPIKSIDDTLRFFRTDLCRVWTLVWRSSLKSKIGGLQVYRYFPADTTFDNSTDYPPNSCYKPLNAEQTEDTHKDFDIKTFIKTVKALVQNDSELFDTLEKTFLSMNQTINETTTEKKYVEYPSGVFDLSACHYGAPIYLSNPHFLNADPYYLSKVRGLSPNASLHQTYLDLEPVTGTPVELKLRIQINVRIAEMANYFKQYRKIPKIHFPVLWQQFSVVLTDKIANDLHWTLTWPSIIATIVSSLFVAIGALTLLFVASNALLKRCSERWRSHPNSGDCDTSAPIDDNIDSDDCQQLIS